MKPSDAPEEGITGPSAGGEVADAVETLCVTSKEGVLEVHSEWGAGKIAFRSGRVFHAQVADLEGEAAFVKLVGATAGGFSQLAAAEQTATIARPWEELLIEAIRDEEPAREEAARGEELEADSASLFQMVRAMRLFEKVRFAMKCGKEARTLLIRDGSRAVQLGVISNSRITEGEIARIACSKTLDEEILRRIAESREWTKYYPVRLALANNPKTPLAIAIKLLPTLLPQDVAQIAKSKDVSALIAIAARRLMLQKV